MLLAGLGVALLGFDGATSLNLAGVLFALLAGAMWAAYILLSAQTGRRWPGFDGLALASVVATLLLTPLAVGTGGSDLLDPRILLLGAVVGLLSSVIPYSCELVALRSLRPVGVLDPDEPRARRRRTGRHHRPRRVPQRRAVGRDGLRRRSPPSAPPARAHRGARARLTHGGFEARFARTSTTDHWR